MISRRSALTILGGSVAVPWVARAQERKPAKRVAFFSHLPAEQGAASLAAFEEALRADGWLPGTDVIVDSRFGRGEPAVYPKYADELIARAPDVIIAQTTAVLKAVRARAGSIPIVFANLSDPVGQRIVPSLAHPGGTITGFAGFDFTSMARWLQLVRELVPGLKRVLVLYNPQVTPAEWTQAATQTAPTLGLAATLGPVRNNTADIETVIGGFTGGSDVGLLVVPGSFNLAHRKEIVAAVARHRLPAIYVQAEYVRDGGLMCGGGIDPLALLRDSASYVGRILRGAKPGDLPVQYPTKFAVLINLRTAKALGITIAPSLLARADEVIE